MCRILQKEGSVGVVEGPHNFQPYRLVVNNGICSHERRVELCPQCRTYRNPRDKACVDSLWKSGVAFSIVKV